MNTAEIIIQELRQGERTTSELMEAASVTRNAILCAISKMTRRGVVVVNLTPPLGGHHEGRWQLLHDPERPTARICAWLGCSTRLNRYNPSQFCLNHRAGMARMVAAGLDARIKCPGLPESSEQLAISTTSR